MSMKHINEIIKEKIDVYDEIQERVEKVKKLKESLTIETEKGYKYIIDNKLTYYYKDNYVIRKLNFKEIFEESINDGFVSNSSYKEIERFLGNEAAKYFYYKFKIKLKEECNE